MGFKVPRKIKRMNEIEEKITKIISQNIFKDYDFNFSNWFFNDKEGIELFFFNDFYDSCYYLFLIFMFLVFFYL